MTSICQIAPFLQKDKQNGRFVERKRLFISEATETSKQKGVPAIHKFGAQWVQVDVTDQLH